MQIYRNGPDTDRLQHRAWTSDDAEMFFALNSDPNVLRYTGEPAFESLDQARQAIAT